MSGAAPASGAPHAGAADQDIEIFAPAGVGHVVNARTDPVETVIRRIDQRRRGFFALALGLMAAREAIFTRGTTSSSDSNSSQLSSPCMPTSATWTYYLFRPLTRIDGAITGMRFHIGPHQ